MRIVLHGGFGEKGRTSIGVETGGYRLLLDAGVNTSVRGSDGYYPRITRAQLESTDAIVVTHGHEDHVAALGWCLAEGFRGRIFMTPQTRRDAVSVLEGYAEPAHRRLVDAARIEVLPLGVDALRLGPLSIATGRSGHVAGGLWCALHDGRTRFVYCGDVLPSSAVFTMDALAPCDAMAIDASYGEDSIRGDERARQISAWVAKHERGCALPTPLYGRSAELLSIVEGPLALAPGMREALAAQLEETDWLIPGIVRHLAARLDAAAEWREGEPLPRAALLCHDGMGMAGPSQSILPLARSTRHPTLITGHLPEGTFGHSMVAEGFADWIRLPTHPTLDENVALVRAADPSTLLGHSCDHRALAGLARHLPRLRTDLSTGDSLEL